MSTSNNAEQKNDVFNWDDCKASQFLYDFTNADENKPLNTTEYFNTTVGLLSPGMEKRRDAEKEAKNLKPIAPAKIVRRVSAADREKLKEALRNTSNIEIPERQDLKEIRERRLSSQKAAEQRRSRGMSPGPLVNRPRGVSPAPAPRPRGVSPAPARASSSAPALNRARGTSPALNRSRGVSPAPTRVRGVSPAPARGRGVSPAPLQRPVPATRSRAGQSAAPASAAAPAPAPARPVTRSRSLLQPPANVAPRPNTGVVTRSRAAPPPDAPAPTVTAPRADPPSSTTTTQSKLPAPPATRARGISPAPQRPVTRAAVPARPTNLPRRTVSKPPARPPSRILPSRLLTTSAARSARSSVASHSSVNSSGMPTYMLSTVSSRRRSCMADQNLV